MRTLACLSTSPTALRRARIAQRSRGATIIFFLSTANKMESNRVNCILRRRGEARTVARGVSPRNRAFSPRRCSLPSPVLFCWADRTKTKRARPATPLNAIRRQKTRTHGTTRRDFVRRAKTEHTRCWELPKHSHHHHIQSSSSSSLWHSVFFFSSSFTGLAMVAVVLRASLGVCAFVAKRDSSISALYSVLDGVMSKLACVWCCCFSLLPFAFLLFFFFSPPCRSLFCSSKAMLAQNSLPAQKILALSIFSGRRCGMLR